MWRSESMTATHCNTLPHTAAHRNTLQHAAIHCNTQAAVHTENYSSKWQKNCNALQHKATHCDTKQHTGTHCNTLQHIATHCHTLQHTGSSAHGTLLVEMARNHGNHCNQTTQIPRENRQVSRNFQKFHQNQPKLSKIQKK